MPVTNTTVASIPTAAIHPDGDEMMGLMESALKARRESASQIDEFFEEAVDDGGRGLLMGLAERFSSLAESRDWDDITTSLSKIDPDNAEMLELGQQQQAAAGSSKGSSRQQQATSSSRRQQPAHGPGLLDLRASPSF